jgi:zinc protease
MRPSRLAVPAAVLACLLALFAVASLAQPPVLDQDWVDAGYLGPRLEPIFHPLPENVEILTLENGLRVILMRNPAQPMVGIYTQVLVGSAYEDFRTSGMTHMLEHLLFNGTEEMSQEELYALADRLGAYNNANTADFYTNFMLVLPADELAEGLRLQSQMLLHSTLPPDKFEKEKGIVLGELVRTRDMPGHFAAETLREVLYAGSSLALPTLGTRATIAHMVRDDVHAFYRSWFVPNNMVLTLAGNFERDEALALLATHYGEAAPGTLDRPPLVPAFFPDRSHAVVRRGGGQRILALAFDAPGYGSPDFFPFLVMTQLLDAPASGILTRALDGLPQEERPELAVSWEKAEGFARLVLEFELPAGTDPGGFYRLVQEAGAAALDFGITEEDVAEIVQMEETETLLQREQLRHTGIYTAEPIALGGPDFFVSYLPRLREVVAEDVARMLRTYLIDTPCQAALVEPEAGAAAADEDFGLPEGMEVPPAMLEALRRMQREGGMPGGGEEGEEADAGASEGAGAPGGAAGGPAAGARPAVRPASLPVERSVLENGSVLVSQSNPTSPLMAIHLTVRNRAMVDDGHPGALNLIHHLLNKGIGGCDETCLQRKLRRLGAKVKLADDPAIPMDDYYTTGRFSFVRVEVTAENGPQVLELLADMTQHASFSQAEFERVRRGIVSDLEAGAGSARTRANRLLAEALYGGHPLARPPEGDPESVRVLSYDDARTIYRRAFSPENLIWAVVSPHPHEELRAQLEQLLPGRRRGTESLPPLPATTAAARFTGEAGGEMAAIRLGSLFQMDPADEKALEILTAILSDRIAMDLRETRGMSYSVGAAVDMHGGEAEFTAWINPPRERSAEAEAALAGAVAGFDPATVTQDELDRVRSARVGRWMMRRLSSMSQAYYLAMAELDGSVARYLEMLDGYDELTLADLARVERAYLAPLEMVTVVVE